MTTAREAYEKASKAICEHCRRGHEARAGNHFLGLQVAKCAAAPILALRDALPAVQEELGTLPGERPHYMSATEQEAMRRALHASMLPQSAQNNAEAQQEPAGSGALNLPAVSSAPYKTTAQEALEKAAEAAFIACPNYANACAARDAVLALRDSLPQERDPMQDWAEGLPAFAVNDTTPHLIADAATDDEKAKAFEWLRQQALGGNRQTARLAAIAQDEWHRCNELAAVSETAQPTASEAWKPHDSGVWDGNAHGLTALLIERDALAAQVARLLDERAALRADGGTAKMPEGARLCYNRATKKIEKLVHGICVESFDPPEEKL